MPDELYSKGVQLWDKNGASASLNNGSGLLLHPETELKYVKPEVGGGISSSVNSLWFDPNAAMVSGLSGIIADSYCPLEKVNAGALGGNTQYANMYTGGIESAVVTELPGSTGYGTLVNTIQTITSVRPTTGTNSATNSYIPTERAVALALAGKENIVVGGACIDVTKDVASTTVAVKTQSGTLPTLANAVDSRVPTERCARQALDVTSEVLNASASALSNRLTALSSYVIDSTVKITDYATNNSAGIVKPTTGLVVAANGAVAVSKASVIADAGNISAYQGAYTLANTSAVGGVVCTNKVESAGVASYKNEPIVPTVQAVWDYVSEYAGGGGAVVKQGTGITVTSDTPLTSYTVKLNAAQASVIGGVQVPQNKGLTLGTNGSLTLQAAPETINYNDAYTKLTANNIGGVLVTNDINAFFEEGQLTVVPTAAAVASMFINAIDLPFKIKSTHHDDAADQYVIAAGYVYLNGTFVTYVEPFSGTIPTVGNDITLYLHLTRSSASSNWTVASPSYVTTAGTDNDTNKYIAIGQLMLQHSGDSSDIESIRQIQYGNIDLATGTGGQTSIAQGTGITVTGQAATGYTVSLNKAQTNTIGGVYVPADVGITLNTNTGAISLNRAGYTSAAYGGVWVDGETGLSVITATTNKGKLYLNEAPPAETYDAAVTAGTTGNIGGVVIMKSIVGATTTVQSNCPVVPTVDAVYQAIQQGGGGGRVVEEATNGRINVNSTADTSKYIISAYKAGKTANNFGGVYVPDSSGLTLDTATGELKAAIAGATVAGVVKVGTGLNMSASVTGGSADTLYVTNGGGGAVVSAGVGIYVASDTPLTSYTVALKSATTFSSGGVLLKAAITIPYNENNTIPTEKAIVDYIKDSGYQGPFAVHYSSNTASTYDSTVVNISSGYVKWLDGQIPRASSNGIAMANGAYMYLCGSSGCVLGTAISNATYQIVVGGKTYNRTSTTSGNKTVWSSSTEGYQLWKTTTSPVSSCWTTATITSVGDIAYQTSAPTAETSVGSITAVTNTITTGAVVYTRDDTGDAENTLYSGYVWSGTSNSGGVDVTVSQYTGSAYPLNGAKTLPKVSQVFSYTTVQPPLPPAGAFYTMLAYNSGGKLYQQQYGTIWHEHWGDDYRGQFAISRSTLKQTTADTAAFNTYPYRYNVNGGILYGSADYLKHGRLFWGTPISGGLILSPGDISYPIIDSSTAQGKDTLDKLKADGVITNGTTELYDGLYVPYGTGANVWLNIWSGTWPVTYGGAATDPDWWWAVAHTICLEGIIPNCYSVQLGWITNNGAPQQDKKGSIAIRGRWA